MTGTLAQIVTLTSFGNDYLYNGKLRDDFFSRNQSFQFCNKVDFRVFKRPFVFLKRKSVAIADTPAEWFRFLKNDGCRKLRLYFQNSNDQSYAKDFKLAGLVGGGGTWMIEAIYDSWSNGWANRWEVTDEDSPEKKIWTVNYGMVSNGRPTIDMRYDQRLCKDELSDTLLKIEEFAFQYKLTHWCNQFKTARERLNSADPESGYYNREMVPENSLSLISRQILFSAGTAWVVGAMGSWNDLRLQNAEENRRYEDLTETLYSKVNQAIISATNSY